MEQNKNKDKWVEEILSSTENIERAEAGLYIYPKILYRIKDTGREFNFIPFKKAAFGFTTVVLLAVLNIFVVFSSVNNPKNRSTQDTESLFKSTENQLIPSQVNPYLEILDN